MRDTTCAAASELGICRCAESSPILPTVTNSTDLLIPHSRLIHNNVETDLYAHLVLRTAMWEGRVVTPETRWL